MSTAGRLKPFEERNDEAALRSRRILARSRAENLGHPLGCVTSWVPAAVDSSEVGLPFAVFVEAPRAVPVLKPSHDGMGPHREKLIRTMVPLRRKNREEEIVGHSAQA